MNQAETGIPVGQVYAPQAQSGEFSTGLCDCFSDCSLCCLTYWCPCITFGRIAEIVDRGSPSCVMSGALYTLVMILSECQCLYSCIYRSKLKALYGMEESCCGDCCTHFWCESCALCQEYRELENRGYDLALGWHGNMLRQNQGMVPPTSGWRYDSLMWDHDTVSWWWVVSHNDQVEKLGCL